MRIITWNVNHRARCRRIPTTMAEAICSLTPDVIVLNEYVEGPSHEDFMAALESCGFSNTLMSPFVPKENRVLISARDKLVPGTIMGPPRAVGPLQCPSCPHREPGAKILGLRVPDYSREPAVKRACWDWIESVAASAKERPFMMLGDFNTDSKYPRARCGDRIARLVDDGWQHAVPQGSVSHWTLAGYPVQIDHAFVSRHFRVDSAKYITEGNGHVYVGKRPKALSSHASLLIEVSF